MMTLQLFHLVAMVTSVCISASVKMEVTVILVLANVPAQLDGLEDSVNSVSLLSKCFVQCAYYSFNLLISVKLVNVCEIAHQSEEKI